MATMDPIADMLTRIRNANQAQHKSLTVPFSRVKNEIAQIIKDNGFIASCNVADTGNNKKDLVIELKYGPNKERVIYGLRRISKCGRRYYVGASDIPWVQGGLGIALLSTSKGIVTDKDARKMHVGGEVLCYIW